MGYYTKILLEANKSKFSPGFIDKYYEDGPFREVGDISVCETKFYNSEEFFADIQREISGKEYIQMLTWTEDDYIRFYVITANKIYSLSPTGYKLDTTITIYEQIEDFYEGGFYSDNN